jgi:hypothetical protein
MARLASSLEKCFYGRVFLECEGFEYKYVCCCLRITIFIWIFLNVCNITGAFRNQPQSIAKLLICQLSTKPGWQKGNLPNANHFLLTTDAP